MQKIKNAESLMAVTHTHTHTQDVYEISRQGKIELNNKVNINKTRPMEKVGF